MFSNDILTFAVTEYLLVKISYDTDIERHNVVNAALCAKLIFQLK